MARYRLQEWLNFITSELHKSFSPLFKPQTPEETKQLARDTLSKRIALVDQTLQQTPYLMGDQFTVADAYLFTVLRWAQVVKLDLAPWPGVTRFLEQTAARPQVQAALVAEGLAPA